ncbi:MAG: malate dehydrogenase [Bacteroidaceae bacterium]|nr:malate dehydrogenase [Bacteroidaceae bacterium]
MQQEDKKALKYHSEGRPGKIEVIPTKPLRNHEEIALAYTPGAIIPAKDISDDVWNAYKYTNKGNLVAVISNGSKISDSGNLGAAAVKPLLEGRSMLFKIYADIDAFDIEIAEENSDKLVEIIHSMAGTFGAIELSNIEAKQSYFIKQQLCKLLDIPIIDDNMCGKAVCCAAAIMNATEFACKEIKELKVVLSSNDEAISSTLSTIGIKHENIVTLDENKEQSLSTADVFIGLSQKDITESDITAMPHDPIVILLSGAVGRIDFEKARLLRPDAIFSSCSADAPNLINEAIAFPYIFRAALDTLAGTINENMLLAATTAIAMLARRPVPASLKRKQEKELSYNREYILPLPSDRRLATEVTVAVAKAAIESGTARHHISDWEHYCDTLLSRLEREYSFHREIFAHHRSSHKLHSRYTRAMPSIISY